MMVEWKGLGLSTKEGKDTGQGKVDAKGKGKGTDQGLIDVKGKGKVVLSENGKETVLIDSDFEEVGIEKGIEAVLNDEVEAVGIDNGKGKSIGIDEVEVVSIDKGKGKTILIDEVEAVGIDKGKGKSIGIDEVKAVSIDKGKGKTILIDEVEALGTDEGIDYLDVFDKGMGSGGWHGPEDVEWGGIEKDQAKESGSELESDSEYWVEGEDDDFDCDLGSADENVGEGSSNTFSSSSVFNPQFNIGQSFHSKLLFKDSVKSHGVLGEECFQIRKLNNHHSCAPNYHVKTMTSTWLSKRCVEDFRADPKKDLDGLRTTVVRSTRDYANALRSRNPGSTKKICVDKGPDGTNRFSRLYVCFQAMKVRFLTGCRPFIGVDGTFLKGTNAGVLLTAVSVDPNNQIFPIAYAVVNTENTET
ncbi:hypothetical protein ACS0TY_018032 [Phlomoides rotata]